jgi:geranylgeranyl diphosphate synthase type II
METLDSYSALLEEKISEFFAAHRSGADHPSAADIYSALEEYCLRKGKRIASYTTLLTYRGYGAADGRILWACLGIEFYRHGILIHDDIVDEDAERRGGRAFHRLFHGEERLGRGIALFAGNLLYAHALGALARGGFRRDKQERVRSLLIDEYRNVNESQCLDLFFEYGEPSLEEWRSMASKRAASLFRATMLTGAVLADAPEGELPVLEKAAMEIGYSFDITDDIIGSFADEEEYGRPPGGDIILGKKPLHVVHAYTLLRGGDRGEFRRLLKKRSLTQEEVERVKELIIRCGALEEAKSDSRRHAEAAKDALAETSMSAEAKEKFTGLIDYVSESLDWYK